MPYNGRSLEFRSSQRRHAGVSVGRESVAFRAHNFSQIPLAHGELTCFAFSLHQELRVDYVLA